MAGRPRAGFAAAASLAVSQVEVPAAHTVPAQETFVRNGKTYVVEYDVVGIASTTIHI